MRKPNEKEFKDLRILLGLLQKAEDYCRDYFDRGKRWYRLWRFGSAVDEDDWPYVNRTRTKDIFAFCEDSTALTISSLLATLPLYSVITRETSVFTKMFTGIDPGEVGTQIEKALSNQIEHEDVEFLQEMTDFIKSGQIFGNSYLGVYPKFDEDGNYIRPLIKGHEFWDVMPIPRATRVTKARGIFIREFMTPEDLETLKSRGFKNIEGIIADTPAGLDVEWHKTLLQELGMESYVVDENNKEVLHYFSNGDVISMVDRGTIIRDTRGDRVRPYPYALPQVQYKYIPVPFEFFAMGIPEVLESLQEDRNLIRSARRDNIDLIIHKILLFRQGADLNLDLIGKAYPSALWPVTDLEGDVKEFPMTDVSQSAYNEEQLLSHDEENAMSFWGYARGMTPPHQEQPTTVMRLQQASLNRLDLAIKLAEFGVLQQIGSRVMLLMRRYMPQEMYEEIIGEPDKGFYQLSEEQLRRFYYVKPVGSSVTHIRELKQQAILQAIQTLPVLEERSRMSSNPFEVNYYKTAKEYLETVEVPDANEMIRPLQQIAENPLGDIGMPQPNMMEQLAQQMYGGM